MKTINNLIVLALVWAISFGLSSCSKDDISDGAKDGTDEYVEVPFKFSGDIVDMGATPMSRAESTDLYYIQVFVLEIIEGENRLMQYAHGLFDDISNISVKLKKNDKYMAFCNMVKDGKNLIYSETKGEYLLYRLPFNCPLTNSFDYFVDFYECIYGEAKLVDGGYYATPDIIRYFGISDIYDSSMYDALSVTLRNMSFRLDIKTIGFTEGEIRLRIPTAPEIVIDSKEKTKSVYISMYSMLDAYSEFLEGVEPPTEEYTEQYNITVDYIDGQGKYVNVGTRDLNFKRNEIKNITVNVP